MGPVNPRPLTILALREVSTARVGRILFYFIFLKGRNSKIGISLKKRALQSAAAMFRVLNY